MPDATSPREPRSATAGRAPARGTAWLLAVLVACALGAPALAGPTPQEEAAGHGAHDHDAPEHDASEHDASEHDGSEHHALEHHGHGERMVLTDLRCGWWQPWEHVHASVCGTPFVHGFLAEPAFLGRDLFLDLSLAEDETEVEAELEWALTRRIGLLAEVPFIDEDETGFGDAALGVRVLLGEWRRFLLSANAEVELPTGDEDRGLGRGAAAVGAGLAAWADLGHWVTAQGRLGLEHVPEDDETELLWSVTLAKSWCARPLFAARTCGGEHHGPDVFSVIAEIAGATGLEGEAEGETEGRWLLGLAHPLTPDIEIRAAFSRSFGGEEDEEAVTLGLIIHL